MMERIVLEVDSNTAKKWGQASATQRRRILAFLNNVLDQLDEPNADGQVKKGYALPSEQLLERHGEKAQRRLPEYLKLLDEMGAIAEKNGLTQEALNELLAEDD